MRILFFGRHDWANCSNRVARAINASGAAMARVCTERVHPFGYQEDMVVSEGTQREFLEFFYSADWIISTGDGDYDYLMRTIALLAPSKPRLATCHVGSAYRAGFENYNDMDAQIGFSKRFIGGDLYRFAKDDPTAVPFFAPPNELAPPGMLIASGGERRVRIGHSPTNRKNKGTTVILEAFSGLDADVDVIEGVSFKECSERRVKCDVFVDQLNPEIGGFGASAVEALAAGCVVLADIRNVCLEVNRFYPPPPILDVRDIRELRATLEDLLNDRELLWKHRQWALTWAATYASPEAVARYWLEHLK